MTTAETIATRQESTAGVIIADDNKVNLLVLRKMLNKLGVTPRTAADGLEAVALADGEPPTLVLLDINMPRMNGIEAAAAIRKRHPNTDIPIIAVTAYADSQHQEDYRMAGFDTLIAKPVTMATLQRVLSDYLGEIAKAA